MPASLNESQHRFVEQFGNAFEQLGMPRIAGRMLGWLIVCDPKEQSAKQLAEVLNISTGSVSTMARMLESFGYVEHEGVTGSRQRLYRLRDNMWVNAQKNQLPWLTKFRQLAEDGINNVTPLPDHAKLCLSELRDFYRFMEQRLPALLEEWEQNRQSKEN